jgi:Coenzyme Q (ubiquinone) biosynthesis protein Coq4
MGNMDRCAARMRALSIRFPYRLQPVQTKQQHLLRQNNNVLTSASRWLATTSAESPSPRATDQIPFYGLPRPETEHRPLRNRIAVALHSATTAFTDPARADAVAALGEISGSISLRRLHQTMINDPTGRLILQDRPVVSKATIPYEQLMADAPKDMDQASNDIITFGQAYGAFLKGHGFDPDERDAVKYIDDEELAYVMLRYRQVGC